MDILIEKIKDVEREARNIIFDAESDAHKMLDEAKYQATSKLDKTRAKAHSTYTQSLKDKIDEANQKKEEIFNEKIQNFYNKLGNIDDKKRTVIETLKNKIKNLMK
jgi:vacuolar-type H+-ATPase subunit H